MNKGNRHISNYLVTVALIGGATLFGFLSKPTEMGIFVVACAMALFFINVDLFKSFKGGGVSIETKPDKASELEKYRLNEELFIQSAKSEIGNYLTTVVNDANSELLSQIRKEIDYKLQSLPAVLEEKEFITVDTNGYGEQKIWRFPIHSYSVITELLDDVFLSLNEFSAMSYNRQWVLIDTKTEQPLKNLHLHGPIKITDAGITGGMKLRVDSMQHHNVTGE